MESATNHVKAPKYMIAIGASAGGLNALSELITQLKPDIDAAIAIVMHLSRKAISDYLLHRIQQETTLKCYIAKDGLPVTRGSIYIASPNYHLVIQEGKVILGRGPQENRWRPSIDVLFRSVAAAYNGHTIGIVLTGLLNDGSSGMIAIKRTGGICIVQDPNEAEYPDMPLSVLNAIEVDYCVSLAEMGTLLNEITEREPEKKVEIPLTLPLKPQLTPGLQ